MATWSERSPGSKRVMEPISETVQMIEDAIRQKARVDFPAWRIESSYHDPTTNTYKSTSSTNVWFKAYIRQGSVFGTITIVWTRSGKGKVTIKSRWMLKPMAFATREMKAAFLAVSEEMSHNAPKIELLLREEAKNMGDPMELLSKTAKKSLK